MVGDALWTEVRVSFGTTILEVTHLRPGQCFTLGEGPEADLTYATPGLHRLVIATASGAVLEHLDSGALVALGAGERTCVELGALRIEIGCKPQLVPELGWRPIELGWWLSLMSAVLVVVPFLVLALGAAEFVPQIETIRFAHDPEFGGTADSSRPGQVAWSGGELELELSGRRRPRSGRCPRAPGAARRRHSGDLVPA